MTLLKQIANPRDQQAWARFHARYAPMIRGWLVRQKVKDPDVEDLTPDVLLKIARAIRTFRYDPKRSFRGWLRTIVNNRLRDFLDHLKLRLRHGDLAKGGTTYRELLAEAPDELADSMVDQLEEDISGLVKEVLREAKKLASSHDWRVWQASRKGQTDQEIGRLFGKKVGAIHQAKWRVNQIIRQIIKKKAQG